MRNVARLWRARNTNAAMIFLARTSKLSPWPLSRGGRET
jgi:hypothetical protein